MSSAASTSLRREYLQSAALVTDSDFTLYVGDVREVLAALPDESIDCCVTSPPYWGLRDYGVDGQLGLERTPDEFVAAMVAVFAQVRRVLKPHGTLWLNLGDSYNAYNGGAGPGSKLSKTQTEQRPKFESGFGLRSKDLKPKDLIGVPWLVAFALRADGWYLRSDIIWAKPNPMPESITDRPTKAHEYLFLLSKSSRYHYDADAIREPYKWPGDSSRYLTPDGWATGPGAHDPVTHSRRMRNGFRGEGDGPTAYVGQKRGQPNSAKNERSTPTWEERKAAGATRGNVAFADNVGAGTQRGVHGEGLSHDLGDPERGRNRRSVWEIATEPFPDAHFATFPQALVEPCLLAGCPEGGVVLDPFMGSGTTALVARRLGRRSIGVELNPDYARLAAERLSQLSLLAEEATA